MVDEEVRRVARLLESVARTERVTFRELERRLDLSSGTLNRIFSGKIELKVRHVLLILEALGVSPLTFFEQAFKIDEGDEEQAANWMLESVDLLRRRPWMRFPDPASSFVTEEELRHITLKIMGEMGFSSKKKKPEPSPQGTGDDPPKKEEPG